MARKRERAAVRQAGVVTSTAAYVRVSTDEQARSGLGLASQRSRCAAMALVKDWPHPEVYADEGISGTKGVRQRPELARLIEDVRAGKHQAVIILSLDRLGRKTQLVLELVEELNACGVSLVSCKESLDTATPQGQFVLTMFAALAQLERDLIAERTQAALAEHDKRDGEKGGRVPFGYVRSDAGLRVDRKAANAVRRIFALRALGHSLRAIAARMDRVGPRTDGKRWRHTSIKEILDNEMFYRGSLRGASQLRWPAILRADGVALIGSPSVEAVLEAEEAIDDMV